ncbi:MAG: hypothetical protein RLZZ488_1995 [Pseudomonadota bacterium]|jgi:adenosine deaminase
MPNFPDYFWKFLERGQVRRSMAFDISLESFHQWVSAQPKIETHVHMEAAVASSFYLQRPAPDSWSDSLPWQRLPFESLRGFIRAWVDLSKSMRSLNDFECLAEAFVAERVVANIRYSEVYVSPADFSFIRKRFSIAPEIFEFEDVVRAYIRGLKRGLAQHEGFEVRLIVDSLWISDAGERTTILQSLKNILQDSHCSDSDGHSYVIGVGLGGMENHENLQEKTEFFAVVRDMGLKIDIHSGEGGDSEIHLGTLNALQPDRVAHGFAGAVDGYFFEKNLVMCPLSNLLLKTFAGEPHEHPVFDCLKRGLPVCIGSDDPLLLSSSLALDYTFLHAFAGNGHGIFEFTQKNTRERVLSATALARVVKFL